MVSRKVGAPRNNQNRSGKGVKEKKRIQVNMSVSDRCAISDGVLVDLRARFEEYLLAQGLDPSEEAIKSLARQWAYEAWWFRLKRAEDEQSIIF